MYPEKFSKLKKFSLIFITSVMSFFAMYGAYNVTVEGHKIIEPKLEELNAKLKVSFGQDVVVKDNWGGPAPEIVDEDLVTYLKRYTVRDDKPLPKISAKYFLVGDVETGQIIASSKESEAVPIASLTKLMTAVVADESIGLDKETVISNTAVDTYGQQGRLKRGEVYTIEELLYPLLLESSNDAAEAIAEYDNHFAFMLDMNSKAKLLNMNKTFFDDPSGLSSKNISSASDLFELVQYINKYRNYIFDISVEKNHKIGNKVWYLNSKFRTDKNYVGGKNGYTDEAGKTNIGIFKLKLDEEGDDRKIAIIVLNSPNTEKDTRAIISYLQKYVYYQ